MKKTDAREQDERTAVFRRSIPSLVTLRSLVRTEMPDATDEVVCAIATLVQAMHEDWDDYSSSTASSPWSGAISMAVVKMPADPNRFSNETHADKARRYLESL